MIKSLRKRPNSSNFTVLLEQLGGESDSVRVEEASHWAVGWVKYLIVVPTNHKSLRQAIYAHSAIYDYPILDENHFSELEYTEAWEFAEGELKKYEGWEEAFTEAIENCGFYEDETWGAIEEARKILEAKLEEMSSANPPIMQCPGQMSFGW